MTEATPMMVMLLGRVVTRMVPMPQTQMSPTLQTRMWRTFYLLKRPPRSLHPQQAYPHPRTLPLRSACRADSEQRAAQPRACLWRHGLAAAAHGRRQRCELPHGLLSFVKFLAMVVGHKYGHRSKTPKSLPLGSRNCILRTAIQVCVALGSVCDEHVLSSFEQLCKWCHCPRAMH